MRDRINIQEPSSYIYPCYTDEECEECIVEKECVAKNMEDLKMNMNMSMCMNIINLTPHDVNIVPETGEPVLTIPASGNVARLTSETVEIGEVNGIPITKTRYGDICGLPDESAGVCYIVSALVAQQCKHRNDIFIPNECVRDERGRIVGCKSLSVI